MTPDYIQCHGLLGERAQTAFPCHFKHYYTFLTNYYTPDKRINLIKRLFCACH